MHIPDILDTTRRTLSQAHKMPQWQRLIDSVHNAQGEASYRGRQFGLAEMRHFGATLIGKPVEHSDYPIKAKDFSVYWVERQSLTYSTGEIMVRYVLKAVYGDDLARVETLTEQVLEDPSDKEDQGTAIEFVRRANFQVGRTR